MKKIILYFLSMLFLTIGNGGWAQAADEDDPFSEENIFGQKTVVSIPQNEPIETNEESVC